LRGSCSFVRRGGLHDRDPTPREERSLAAVGAARGPCASSWSSCVDVAGFGAGRSSTEGAPVSSSPWWGSFGAASSRRRVRCTWFSWSGPGPASGPRLPLRSPWERKPFARSATRAASPSRGGTTLRKERAPKIGRPSHHSTTFARRFTSVGRSELRPFPPESGSRIDSVESAYSDRSRDKPIRIGAHRSRRDSIDPMIGEGAVLMRDITCRFWQIAWCCSRLPIRVTALRGFL
jgi:hypothetical protein